MSQENVELVRGAFQAFQRGGIEAALSFFSPDCVWHPTNRWLEDSAYRGHDGMRRLAASFADNFDSWEYDVTDTRDADDRVIALGVMSGQIKSSRAPISQTICLVVSGFHDDTFGEIRAFASWREALEAAGLAD
jgi:ketosteroid isomerase-like protein